VPVHSDCCDGAAVGAAATPVVKSATSNIAMAANAVFLFGLFVLIIFSPFPIPL
jgi:uncharacterized membrane protein YadS